MAEEPVPLPNFIVSDPLVVERDRQRQKLVSDMRARGRHQSAAEVRTASAILAEPMIRRNLSRIDKDKHPEAYRETQLQLAEALAGKGEFTEAAKMATRAGDAVLSAEYKRYSAAVNVDDDQVCKCPAAEFRVQTAQGLRPIQISQRSIVAEVFSKKHNRIVPVVRCAVCGHTNATEVAVPVPDVEQLESNR